MKRRKIKLAVLVVGFISVIAIMAVTINSEAAKINNVSKNYKEKLIRFHVLANSDTDEDQALKLKVRDEIIAYLQPKLKKSKNIEESEKIIRKEFNNLNKISRKVIIENGYDYGVSVNITYSDFPTKQYSNMVLPAGQYKALKVIIGKGEGKNWWCVMFPPLCFVDDEKSAIDKETDDKLRSILTEEEYKLITKESKNSAEKTKMKFKFVEILEKIEKNF